MVYLNTTLVAKST